MKTQHLPKKYLRFAHTSGKEETLISFSLISHIEFPLYSGRFKVRVFSVLKNSVFRTCAVKEFILPVGKEITNIHFSDMGQNWDKFLLLMWKNLLIQRRRWIQTIFDLLLPLTFAILLVVSRSLVDPKIHNHREYQAFCPLQKSQVIPFHRLCEQKALEPMKGTTYLG